MLAIGLVVRVPNVLAVGSGTPFHTLDDFIAAAKAAPGTLTYAVDATYASLAAILPFIQEGRARAIAVTSAQRLPALAEHPDLKGYKVVNWFGLFAPAGTPQPVVDQLNAALRGSLGNPATRARLEGLGTLPSPGTPSDFAAFLSAEATKFGQIIAQAQIKEE
jgi:tripartite-type tricarboxylate transporter receptor subunit TctC